MILHTVKVRQRCNEEVQCVAFEAVVPAIQIQEAAEWLMNNLLRSCGNLFQLDIDRSKQIFFGERLGQKIVDIKLHRLNQI
jgi:hypothetical protein